MMTARVFANEYCETLCRADSNKANNDGLTPAIAACAGGHVRCLLLLIEKGGADLSMKSNLNFNAAYIAILANSVKCLSLVLQEQGLGDINMPGGPFNTTMLQYARQLDFSKIITFLIEKGAVDSADNGLEVLTEEYMNKVNESLKEDRTQRKLVRHCDYPDCDREVPVKQLKMCSLCKEFWYCSESHQHLHWEAHKPVCKRLCF
jgi:ankyrin repeat protein